HRSLGCRRRVRLDLLDQVEAAVDVAERQATELREFEFPPLHAQQTLDSLLGKPVADDRGGNATDDGVGRNVLGDHRPSGDHRTVANTDSGRDVDVMAGPYVVADGHVFEHIGRALEPDEVVVLVDPIERLRVILELVGAEPTGGRVERMDGGPRADRPEGADGRPRDKAVLVHAEIPAGDNIRTDLRVLVEEQWPANGRLDDPGAGIEPDDAVEERGLAAGILKEINRDVGKLHGSIRRVGADRSTSTQISRPFLLMAGLNEIIRPTSTQQHPRKSCQTTYNPARCPPWPTRRAPRPDARDSD